MTKLLQFCISIAADMKASHNTNADNSASKRLAEQAMKDGDWGRALEAWKMWWRESEEQASLDPDAMHDRAVCHFHCGEKEAALSWLNQAADMQPDYSYRYSSRGWMKQASGDIHGAIEDYKKALELDPDDAVTWNNLGLLEEQLGYQEQAKERYRVSDELLGILNEHGIDPESSAPAFNERPAPQPKPTASPAKTDSPEPQSFWGELRRAIGTKEGRSELWTFVTNGFTLRG